MKNGLMEAVDLGLPILQTEAKDLLGTEFRGGKCSSSSVDCDWEVKFGQAVGEDELMVTLVILLGHTRPLLDYGDTAIPASGDPINDRFGRVACERNRCLPMHFEAGGVQSTQERPALMAAMNAARSVRRDQYLQADE